LTGAPARLLALLLAAAGLGAAPAPSQEAEAHFRLGTEALRHRDWPAAIEHLEKARALRPRHVEALYYLAQAYHLDGQGPAGLAAIRRAAALAPQRAELAQKHGELLCEANRCREGLRLLLKARRLDPSLPDLDFDLGMAYHKQAALPEAQRHLQAAWRQDPRNLLAARFLADVLGRQDRWAEARDLYAAVAQREPENAWALYGLGRSLVALGQPEAALAPLREALGADPTVAEAHFQLGQALRELGRREESESELRLFKALRDRAPSAGALSSRRTPFEERVWQECRRLLDQGREAEALAHLRRLSGSAPGRPEYLLGVLAFNLGRADDAARLLARAAAAAPQDAPALASLGRAHVAQGDLPRAEEALRRARTLEPQGELALLGTAELAYARGDWEGAARHFEQSRTRQVPALLKLCRAYLQAGEPAKALEAADLVRAFGKGDAASLRELEEILAQGRAAASRP
jgi:tetratricopeptide (TPR) repeat protein